MLDQVHHLEVSFSGLGLLWGLGNYLARVLDWESCMLNSRSTLLSLSRLSFDLCPLWPWFP